eukprot:3942425-Pleurochrysis_carterae.AAC.1
MEEDAESSECGERDAVSECISAVCAEDAEMEMPVTPDKGVDNDSHVVSPMSTSSSAPAPAPLGQTEGKQLSMPMPS